MTVNKQAQELAHREGGRSQARKADIASVLKLNDEMKGGELFENDGMTETGMAEEDRAQAYREKLEKAFRKACVKDPMLSKKEFLAALREKQVAAAKPKKGKKA